MSEQRVTLRGNVHAWTYSNNDKNEAVIRPGWLWVGTKDDGGIWIGGRKTLLALADAIYAAHGVDR